MYQNISQNTFDYTKLSSSLQEELTFEIRLNVMKTNKVLTKFSQKTLRELSLLIEEVRFSPEDQIIQQGTPDDCSLYLITKGKISILFQNEPQGKITRVLSFLEKGQTFGEYSFFTGLNRTASAKSIGFSRAYKITRQKLLNVLQTNETDLERFCEVRDQILQSENYQPAQLQCYSCRKFDHLIKDCPILHFVPDKEKVIKKEYFPIQQQRNVTYVRQRSDRSYYATLLEMKKTLTIVREFQTNQLQNESPSIVDENSDVSYDDNDDYPYEYSYQNKSQSKISIKQSQIRQNTQNENNHSNTRNLQPIQESEDSDHSVSPNKKRNSTAKNTIQTAGFGGQDSFQNKLKLDDHDINIINVNQGYLNTNVKEDKRHSLKNDRLLSPVDIPNRIGKKQTTNIRKQNREESYQPFSSQTQVDHYQEKERPIKRKSKFKDTQGEIILMSSTQSVDYKRDSIDAKEDKNELKRKTTKTQTNRSRTAKTHKTTKLLSENPSQEISIPIFEKQSTSMELEGFENMKNFECYYTWNNPKVVISKAIRILTKYLERKRNIAHSFSSYTFSAVAINQIIRIKKKLKLLEDPLIDEKRDKKMLYTLNKTARSRVGSKRNSQGFGDDFSSLFQKKPLYTGQTQLSQRISMSKQVRTDL